MTLESMDRIVALGRAFYAIGLVAFGLQHLIYGDFVTRAVLTWPSWIPPRALWAYVIGAGLIAAGVTILTSKRARPLALLLGALFLLSFVCLGLPRALADVAWGGRWTSAMKALVLSGGAFVVAGTLPAATPSRAGRASAILAPLERLMPAGRFFLAAFLLLCGIQHFIWAEGVSTLVPAWMPWRLFWTYFAGVALIAGGVGLLLPMTARLAAALTGLMIFAWVFLVHIPRAVTFWGSANGNETTAVFEALAFSGVAFILARTLPRP